MKSIIILCLFLTTSCLLLEAQGNCINYNGRDLTVGVHDINCNQVTCHPDGHVTALACAVYQCAPGKEIGYRKKDPSKPYPKCCDGPICAD